GGRGFQEVADSYLGYYSHRGTLLWTRNNVVVAPHSAPGQKDYRLVVNLSLDGGRTWVDGTKQGTRAMRQARHFELVASPPGFSFTTPTVELSANHFLTVHCQGSPLRRVEAIFWHIEPTAKPALRVSSARQLFIDDELVESVEGVTRTLHQPTKHPQNPLLARADEQADRWDAGMPTCFSSVLYDPRNRLFKMWYSLHQQGEGDADSVLCFASSRDGIHWHKPALGMYEFRGTKNNNIVVPHSGLACGVFLDPRETDPARRFKMIHMWRDYQVYTSYSADGFRWTPYNDRKPVFFQAPGHDSHMIAYWDAALDRYVGIIRDRTGRISDVRPGLVVQPEARRIWRQLWDPQKNRAPENHSIRRVGQIESTDFVHWDNYRMIIGPDNQDPLNQDQFYNLEVMPYQGLRIGLMTVFSYDPQYSRGAVQLVSSRDGRRWQRVAKREVFLPLATRRGDFDWGSIYPLQAPIEHNDQIWIYYNGYGVDHNHTRPPGVEGMPNGIGLAKLRLDGFVSLDAGPGGGSVTTRPFTFTGRKLVINADATGGQVLVEVLDRRGEPIAGFGKSDCDRVTGDALRHPVSWQGNSELGLLEGATIKLRFHLLRAGLYSFSFPT
ncbi:MAG: hypothetical protein CMJ81_16660, partial [Planctomycetaceae bacterium]|nr:hypothetical protein [Planctomycetaceae bacterium]